jgi:hypothetical protein
MPPEATIRSYSSIVIRCIRGGTQAGTPVAGGIVEAVVDMGWFLQFDSLDHTPGMDEPQRPLSLLEQAPDRPNA